MLDVDGAPKPIRLARPVDPTTISWAPGGKRMSYAGLLDTCSSKRAGTARAGGKNDLFMWDADKKRPARIASAVSRFEAAWMDDGHLLYEGGVGSAARLYVHDAATGTSTPLKVRAGGGLYGYPTIACEEDDDADLHEGREPAEPTAEDNDPDE
jgi:hypothetical protein